eukprot:5795278-Ditylum_brightwellii.AAC.2
MQNIKHDAETWGRLLWVSGGLLEFVNFVYFLIIWAFELSSHLYSIPEEVLLANTVRVTDTHVHHVLVEL